MIVHETDGYFVTLTHHDRDFLWGAYPTEADARAVEARVRRAFAQEDAEDAEDAAAAPPPDLDRARSPDSWRQPALFEQGGPA